MIVRSMQTIAIAGAVALGAALPAVAQTALPLDPCQLMSSTNVAQAMDTTVKTVGTPQHPTPQECVWTVAGKAGSGPQSVIFNIENANNARHCRGLACLAAVQSVMGNVPGMPSQFSSAINTAMQGAQVVNGIGQRAGWKNGALTVINAQQAFNIQVNSGGNDSQRLATSETLARDVIARMPDPQKPQARPQPRPSASISPIP